MQRMSWAVFLIASGALAADPSSDLADLPLTVVPQTGASTDMMGVLLSGDGGWWSLDRTVAETLAAHGVPMIGISSYKYFKTARTPESVADDVARILRHYLAAWHKEKVALVGYSLGAEIMPFVANRLPDDLRKRLVYVALIGPSAETAFQFHLADWIRQPTDVSQYPVQPEIEKLTDIKILCLAADKDKDCICSHIKRPNFTTVVLPGNHHYNNQFAKVAEVVWNECPTAPGPNARR